MKPLIFGEVLFDSFEDGSTVLGGAPFNVAWHLHGFGVEPLLLSRIGDDELGKSILAEMKQWGMDTRGIQVDPRHATGTVRVSHKDGQPSYDITLDVAYDHIEAGDYDDLLTEASVFYHGSLAARNQTSAKSLQYILDNITAPVFLDVNLRPPHWNYDQLDSLMNTANWIKLNDEEVEKLTRMNIDEPGSLETIARQIRHDYKLDSVIVTLGSEGAFVVDDDGLSRAEPANVKAIVDTVGAGDAFSSIFIVGLLSGWNMQVTLDRAVIFAAEICKQRGAVNKETGFYDRFRQEWQL
jgi:fructokinase